MYAIRKPVGDKTDVFVMFSHGNSYYKEHVVEWLREHSVGDGFRDGRVVGVYLRDIDAVAFKLKFGL